MMITYMDISRQWQRIMMKLVFCTRTLCGQLTRNFDLGESRTFCLLPSAFPDSTITLTTILNPNH